MKCHTCKTIMECVDDVNEDTFRADFLECPKCNSKATVTFGNRGEYISKVEWER